MTVQTVGILGAGKLGTTLARHFLAAGYDVVIAGRGEPGPLQLILDTLVPGAVAMTAAGVVDVGQVIILALPLHQLPHLPKLSDDKLTVDATNYRRATDGAMPSFIRDDESRSESVRRLLGVTRFVKAFNHLGYHDLDLLAAPGAPERYGLAFAGDDPDDRQVVSELISKVGFVPVELPSLAAGRILEAGGPIFGEPLTAEQMQAAFVTVGGAR